MVVYAKLLVVLWTILTDKNSKTFPGLLEVSALPVGCNNNSTNQSLFRKRSCWS